MVATVRRRYAQTAMAANPQSKRQRYRSADILVLAIGLVLLAFPIVQAGDACGHAYADSLGSMGNTPLADCDCCQGSRDGSADLSASCSMCAVAVAAGALDVPRPFPFSFCLIEPTLPGFIAFSGLDHPPTHDCSPRC